MRTTLSFKISHQNWAFGSERTLIDFTLGNVSLDKLEKEVLDAIEEVLRKLQAAEG